MIKFKIIIKEYKFTTFKTTIDIVSILETTNKGEQMTVSSTSEVTGTDKLMTIQYFLLVVGFSNRI